MKIKIGVSVSFGKPKVMAISFADKLRQITERGDKQSLADSIFGYVDQRASDGECYMILNFCCDLYEEPYVEEESTYHINDLDICDREQLLKEIVIAGYEVKSCFHNYIMMWRNPASEGRAKESHQRCREPAIQKFFDQVIKESMIEARVRRSYDARFNFRGDPETDLLTTRKGWTEAAYEAEFIEMLKREGLTYVPAKKGFLISWSK